MYENRRISFTLKNRADEDSLKVYVDNILSSSNKWSYNPSGSTIAFNQQNIPEYGQEIQAVYKIWNSKKRQESFELKYKADEEFIKVYVDSVTSPSNNWSYNSSQNVISFHQGYIPESKQEVKVSYKVWTSKKREESFTLKYDMALDEESIQVYIDRVLTPSDHWIYDQEENSIKFYEEYIPEPNQEIMVVYRFQSEDTAQ